MTDSPAGMTPHQLVRAVVGLVDADELPPELVYQLHEAMERLRVRRWEQVLRTPRTGGRP